MRQSGWRFWVKRVFDRTAGTIGLVAVAPIIGAATVAVRATMGSPVFFHQVRPGHHERPFVIWKFRTMTLERGPDGNLLPDVERLTPLGRFLRSTSIDELPQLWCVATGALSLVGPRPLLVKYLERYTPEERRRHDVLPGITGLAAANGRNAISWEEKFRLDLQYVDDWDLALDAKILLKTVWKVLAREGVTTQTEAIMPELQPAHLRVARR